MKPVAKVGDLIKILEVPFWSLTSVHDWTYRPRRPQEPLYELKGQILEVKLTDTYTNSAFVADIDIPYEYYEVVFSV